MSQLLKSSTLVIGAAVLWLGSMAPAEAYAIYTDRAVWQAAVDAVAGSVTTTDTFSNDIPKAQTITLDSGIVSVNSAPPIIDSSFPFDNNAVVGGEYLNATGGGTASATITWTFPASIFAFGADFFRVGADRLTLIGNFDGQGDQSLLVNNTIGGGDGFLGVIGTTDFNSIVFSNSDSVVDAFEMDNASFAAIPEPTTLALLGLGVVGMAVRRRAA